jgi:hypothetical protein
MRYHDGTQDEVEGQRLFERMKDAQKSLLAHQQYHCFPKLTH